ncbi:MAG: acyltransferase [Planctomycetota bacterium]|nr:acyltransferase [Planctomycetota bacterium]MDA1251043.1 acyltransferase [Planctomycetota bacterium]
MSQSQSDGHIAALDGVRGVAILMVFGWHSGLLLNGSGWGERVWLGMCSIGWAGVDLFFVLSGFLISTILIQTREDPHYFRNFFTRRVLRIFPLYFGSLLVLSQILENQAGWTWYCFFAQNWIGVFVATQPPKILGPYWSLAVEEQFYLVWPFVICLLRPRHIPLFCVLVAFIAFAARVVATWEGVNVWLIHGVTIFRLDALALGSLVASLRIERQVERLRWAPALMAASLGGLILIGIVENGYHIEGTWGTTAGFTLMAILSATIIAMIVEKHPLMRMACNFLEWRPLRHFGNRSYAIYVIHLPVLIATKSIYQRRFADYDDSGTLDILCLLMSFVVCLVLSEISWHVVEKPFLRLKRRFPRGEAVALPAH